MPTLGADMTAGTLISWLTKTGERVKRGDIIAEVDTDKGVIEVEVFMDGVIEKLLIEPGQKVPVGTPLAIINENGAGTGQIAAEKTDKAAAVTRPKETTKSKIQRTETQRIHISPVARKLAEELGVDLSKVKGTGPGGRIQREDINRAAEEKRIGVVTQIAESKTEKDRYTRMRRAIAAAMAHSKREIPHYYLSTTIDMTRALDWLEKVNEKHAIKDRILYGILLIKAVALALREIPELNAFWKEDKLFPQEKINVGTAISLRQGGLVAPALLNVDKHSLDDLMKDLVDLVSRTRAGILRSSELSDSTITITNLGEQGVETVFGVIYPPQVALVGFGRIVERPMIIETEITPRYLINATLSADHRASDGHRGSLFLAAIDRILQEPEKL
jgi:pyruvate dehydrogenase E2 component (dihydrolipoamide acetyltransferase)